MRRLCVLAAALILPACTGLPDPEPPAQGAYGYVRHQYVESQAGIEGVVVFAVPVTVHDGDLIPAAAPGAATDHDGNFRLPLPEGAYRLCLADGAIAAQCDCAIEVPHAGAVGRFYQRRGGAPTATDWTGEWIQAADVAACAAP